MAVCLLRDYPLSYPLELLKVVYWFNMHKKPNRTETAWRCCSCALVRRSKKVLIAAGGGHKSSLLSGQDPHMVDNIAETLFPQLSLERSARTTTTTTFNSTAIVNLQPLTIGDKTILLPSLTTDQNYPQMLSEVVANI